MSRHSSARLTGYDFKRVNNVQGSGNIPSVCFGQRSVGIMEAMRLFRRRSTSLQERKTYHRNVDGRGEGQTVSLLGRLTTGSGDLT